MKILTENLHILFSLFLLASCSPKGIQLNEQVDTQESTKVTEKNTEEVVQNSEVTNSPDTERSKEQQAYQEILKRIKVGKSAPAISMNGINGDKIDLIDLKGKVVLIHFWASWCGPCRRENPMIVEVYNKYKDKGFDIYSISLDGMVDQSKKRYDADQIKDRLEQSKQKWKAAIEKDQLTWESHVSDLKKWDSTVLDSFGVKSIPAKYLIDRDGKIAMLNRSASKLKLRKDLDEIVRLQLGL